MQQGPLVQPMPMRLDHSLVQGGIIDTTREICFKLNRLVWTRADMAALNAQANAGKKWSGYKGDIEVYCGGHECRHGWDWVSSSMLLRSRPDLEMVPGKGPFKVRYKAGVLPQQINAGWKRLHRVGR